MSEFAPRVEAISISGIREVFEAAGEDAINLGLGQPDFPAPENARAAAVEAIQAGEADAYTGNKGIRPSGRPSRPNTNAIRASPSTRTTSSRRRAGARRSTSR
ncbi:hypothetical protein ACFQL0_10445 [Haloplanus litoreus]|uniref:hypothetical protein n=1 Tax=Haloplanus litoreus TaxID=767515 RepID=UPI00361CE3B2